MTDIIIRAAFGLAVVIAIGFLVVWLVGGTAGTRISAWREQRETRDFLGGDHLDYTDPDPMWLTPPGTPPTPNDVRRSMDDLWAEVHDGPKPTPPGFDEHIEQLRETLSVRNDGKPETIGELRDRLTPGVPTIAYGYEITRLPPDHPAPDEDADYYARDDEHFGQTADAWPWPDGGFGQARS